MKRSSTGSNSWRQANSRRRAVVYEATIFRCSYLQKAASTLHDSRKAKETASTTHFFQRVLLHATSGLSPRGRITGVNVEGLSRTNRLRSSPRTAHPSHLSRSRPPRTSRPDRGRPSGAFFLDRGPDGHLKDRRKEHIRSWNDARRRFASMHRATARRASRIGGKMGGGSFGTANADVGEMPMR